MKTKRDKEIEELSAHTELKDSWRYFPVGTDDWKLERQIPSPEDSWIEHLDGLNKKAIQRPEEKSGIEWLDLLEDLEKKVVYYYLWDGLSFHRIGKVFGFTKQRAHQIYHSAINKLKEHNNENRNWHNS